MCAWVMFPAPELLRARTASITLADCAIISKAGWLFYDELKTVWIRAAN